MRQKLQSSLPEQDFFVKFEIERYWQGLLRIIPGCLLTFSLASLAFFLRTLPGFTMVSPLILAIVLGLLLRNLMSISADYQPGITFSLKRLLRVAIGLLGLQLSLTQLQQVGIRGFGLIAVVLVATFTITCWLGRYLKVPRRLVCLIAVGTSICGASAIIATATVLDSSDEDTAYAVAIVTVFGTLSMLLYPLSLPLLHLSPEAFGIWCGASIHEVAQAIAAAFQANPISGELASISKLSRVLWLAPMVVFLSVTMRQGSSTATALSCPVIPWFIACFVVLMLLNSMGVVPDAFKGMIGQTNQFLLTVAMAAMGLETRLRQLWRIGLKPLYLGAFSWLFITLVSLGFVSTVY